MGDFNVSINKPGTEYDKLDNFSTTFNLRNLIKSETCFTNSYKSTIDLILTNRPFSFHNTSTIETRSSDFHRLTSTFFKSHYTRLTPNNIQYRDYKKFNERLFLEDLKKENLIICSDNPNEKV